MGKTATFKKNEKAFLLTCLILFFLLGLFLFVDVCSKSGIQADDHGVIGRILFLRNDAWRNIAPGAPLEGLRAGSSICVNDRIVTGEDSAASIALNDGTVVELCGNSSAAFDRSEDEIVVTLEKGCGDFRRDGEGTSGTKRLVVAVDGKKVVVEEAEVSISMHDDRMPELFVRIGSAAVILDGDEETVRENERAVLKRDAASIEEKKLILIGPADSRRYFITGNRADIAFSWEYNGGGADGEAYLLEISTLDDFSVQYQKRALIEPGVKTSIPAGDYFWRVSRNDPATGRRATSETRRFSVIQDSPLKLLNPQDGEVVEYVDELPSIGFSWKEHRYADSYTLEVSEKSDFSQRLMNIDSTVVNYTREWEWDVDPGSVKTYYWRITAKNKRLNWPGRMSSAGHFHLKKVDRLNRPVLVAPRDREKIIRSLAAKDNIIFSWERTDATLKKRILFSQNRNFKGMYREAEPVPDHWIMKNTFPEGKYYWRVALNDDDGNQKVLSGVRSFTVQDIDDIFLVSPEHGSELIVSDVGERGIRFKWEKPDADGACILEVSKSRDFKSIHKSARTSSNTIALDGLPPGNFFWRVRLESESGKVLAGSETRAFEVQGGLDAPVIISPRRGGAVTMLKENELNFLWKPSRQANAYQFELHQLIKDREKTRDKLVLAAQTRDVKYTISDLNLLDVGNFYWTLKAVKKDRRGRVVRFSETVKNKFNINLGESNIIIVSPEIQVIEKNESK